MRFVISVFLALGCFNFAFAQSLSVSPTSLNFFSVAVGGIGQSQTVFVSNKSDQDTNVSVSNTCFRDIHVTNSCFYLNRHATCRVRVEFRPRRPGYQSCALTIRDQKSGESKRVSVSGRGVDR